MSTSSSTGSPASQPSRRTSWAHSRPPGVTSLPALARPSFGRRSPALHGATPEAMGRRGECDHAFHLGATPGGSLCDAGAMGCRRQRRCSWPVSSSGGSDLPTPARKAAAALLGRRALGATSVRELARPPVGCDMGIGRHQGSRLTFGVAEAAWWRRVEEDGFGAAAQLGHGPRPLLGAIAVLAADAWRVVRPSNLATVEGAPLEVFDAVA